MNVQTTSRFITMTVLFVFWNYFNWRDCILFSVIHIFNFFNSFNPNRSGRNVMIRRVFLNFWGWYQNIWHVNIQFMFSFWNDTCIQRNLLVKIYIYIYIQRKCQLLFTMYQSINKLFLYKTSISQEKQRAKHCNVMILLFYLPCSQVKRNQEKQSLLQISRWYSKIIKKTHLSTKWTEFDCFEFWNV